MSTARIGLLECLLLCLGGALISCGWGPGDSALPPDTLDFTYTPSDPMIGESVEFRITASSASLHRDDRSKYLWDFGTGLKGVGTHIRYVYGDAGLYHVILMSGETPHGRAITKTISVTPCLNVETFELKRVYGKGYRIQGVAHNTKDFPLGLGQVIVDFYGRRSDPVASVSDTVIGLGPTGVVQL